ncbi:hypothetical protein ON010_g9110 [Phytophthora cinnamomi]|nr:hypothetical protein ON010_g9110 [Phytophthora cinnamomi]
MTDRKLFPPNNHQLSNNVIGKAHERSRPLPRLPHAQFVDTLATPLEDSARPTIQRWEHHTNFGTEPSPYHNNRLQRTRASHVAPETEEGPSAATHTVSNRGNDRYINARNTMDTLRERRRLTQIRYRKKAQIRSDALEEEVRLLRDEVRKLELQHRCNAPRNIVNTTPFGVVAEYFRLFRFAMSAYVPMSKRVNFSSNHNVYESHAHRNFLHATMAPNVIVEQGCGVEAILKHWRIVTMSQPNFEVEMVRLENGPNSSVIVTNKIGLVVCENMLHHVFPNLAKSERGRQLASKISGQRFVVSGTAYFEWDDDHNCILSLQHKADLVSPIIGCLGNLEDGAFVFDESFATSVGGRLINPSA